MRLSLALAAVCITIAGCGGNDEESARKDAGKTYCQELQKAGGLLEPMSQCLKEYEEATREPN